MKLKNSVLDIPDDDIFRNDKLGRNESVENLTRLLLNVSSPLVFSVNAPWGAGKTTYMKMLHAKLKEAEHRSIYFSAWETDFAVDPLLAFLGEMNISLSALLTSDPKKRKAWDKAKKVGMHILRRGIPVSVKLATFGVVDADKIVEDESAKLTEVLSKDVVEAYSKDKNAIVEFKKNVAEVVKGDGEVVEKLFVFVDELDRCRPTYAIELLERIKHLLDVEGLVFVLALDKSQLAHSVKAVYGADFDALGYLKRFIDIEFLLPNANGEQFLRHLFTHLELDTYFEGRKSGDSRYDKEHLIGTLMAVSGQMSLRSLEQLVSKIKLISLTVPSSEYFFPELVVFLLLVKEQNLQKYNEFCGVNADGEAVLAMLYSIIPGSEDSAVWARQFVEALLIAGKMRDAKVWSSKQIARLQDVISTGKATEKQVENAARVLELVEHFNRGGRGISLGKITNRIDMLSNFDFK